MLVAEVTIAVLFGILFVVLGAYFTHFSINKLKIIKGRVESGDYVDEKTKKEKVMNILLIVYFLMSIAIFTINVYYRSSPIINHQYYVSIKTDSMSQALKTNTYLKNNNLTNQITQYDIAVFDIKKIDTIEKYDIILFKKNKTLIAHRIIDITDEGKYITQGDKNPQKDDFDVEFKDILGKYTHSLKFISFINYLGYTPGFYVALVGVTYILGASLYFDFKKQKIVTKPLQDNNQ